MTALGYSAGALLMTLLAVGYLALIDPKRKQALANLGSKWLPRSRLAGWAIVLLPGLFLIVHGAFSAFLIWFGCAIICLWLSISRTRDNAS